MTSGHTVLSDGYLGTEGRSSFLLGRGGFIPQEALPLAPPHLVTFTLHFAGSWFLPSSHLSFKASSRQVSPTVAVHHGTSFL